MEFSEKRVLKHLAFSSIIHNFDFFFHIWASAVKPAKFKIMAPFLLEHQLFSENSIRMQPGASGW